MGTSADAKLVYGYDLGGSLNGWKLLPAGEYGDFDFDTLDWIGEDDDFAEAVELRLLSGLAGFAEGPWPGTDRDGYYDRKRKAEEMLGVEVVFYGYGPGGEPGNVLAVHTVEQDWSEGQVIDLAALAAMPAANGWDAKLAAAIAALGITPTQEKPGWLLCADYG